MLHNTIASVITILRAITAALTLQVSVVRTGTTRLASVCRPVQNQRKRTLETLRGFFDAPIAQGTVANTAFLLLKVVVCSVRAVAQAAAAYELEARVANEAVGVSVTL